MASNSIPLDEAIEEISRDIFWARHAIEELKVETADLVDTMLNAHGADRSAAERCVTHCLAAEAMMVRKVRRLEEERCFLTDALMGQCRSEYDEWLAEVDVFRELHGEEFGPEPEPEPEAAAVLLTPEEAEQEAYWFDWQEEQEDLRVLAHA